MIRAHTIFMILMLCCTCAGLSACGKPRIDLAVASMPNLNPDHSGRPSPVVIKLYELRGDLAFKQSDFQTLFANPTQALGADLIAADEIVFVPGEAKTISYEPMPETKFAGIVAAFRQMDRAHWRIIVPIDPEGKNRIPFELTDVFITFIGAEHNDWTPEESLRRQQNRITPQHTHNDPVQVSDLDFVQPADQAFAQTSGQNPAEAPGQGLDQQMPDASTLNPSGSYEGGVSSSSGSASSSTTGAMHSDGIKPPQSGYLMPHSKRT